MRSIGIDIGTGSVSLAVLENGAVVYTAYRLHKGDRIRCLHALIKDVQKECPWDMDFGAVNSAGSNCYPGFSESKKTDRLHALLAGRGLSVRMQEVLWKSVPSRLYLLRDLVMGNRSSME